MAGDMIIRFGDVFNEFYIIKSGRVEIIASDGATRLAILEDGAFFGEVAYFTTGKRSCSVKAMTDCKFLVLNREKFETILKIFPEEKMFLMKIARQRNKTSNKYDLPSLTEVNLFFLKKKNHYLSEGLKKQQQ